MTATDKVNVLLVDDQPAKLLAYEVILRDLGQNLIKASCGREALEVLLKIDVAIVLIDVCMPELDGFQLAAMIRDHPRFEKTAIIFISAIHLSDVDRLRGYEMGAVDYVPVPVIPEVLRAKVRVFAELHRKTRQLEQLNSELERRVEERTSDLVASNARLLESERRRSLALAAGQMGSWDLDVVNGDWSWDEGQYRIFGVDPATFSVSANSLRALVHPEDWAQVRATITGMSQNERTHQAEFRIRRPNGELRWCIGTTTVTFGEDAEIVRLGGVTIDITDRKEAEEHQALLAREVDHRARNALAVIQSIVRLTRAKSIDDYKNSVEGRITALARAHTLLSESRWHGADLCTIVAEELAPYRASHGERIITSGPAIALQPAVAQTLALALHELATNAAKYGALSVDTGMLRLSWEVQPRLLLLEWKESGGPAAPHPSPRGFGMKLISTSIDQQLCGKVQFDWDGPGLRCAISIPLQKSVGPAVEDTPKWNEATSPKFSVQLVSPRVLLVEDEALVAMMMQEFLIGLGCSVVGPFGTTATALAAVSNEDLDFAILDINLGGELVYPVADVLAWRGLPFLFITGYDVDSIDERFRHVPVLQKPISRESLRKIFAVSEDETPDAKRDADPDDVVIKAPKQRRAKAVQAPLSPDPSKAAV
jgi:PAS domain S-box-containing protein